jgi:hypothetical protein
MAQANLLSEQRYLNNKFIFENPINSGDTTTSQTPETPEEGRGGEKSKSTFAGSAPRTKPPQLAHHDRGDNYLSEEITRIKRLMK